ncbi:MAG: LLM class flavin-dependent oxidoreductase [Gammaproteobacteria bacterium]
MDIDIILEPDLTPDEMVELGLLAESYGVRALWASNYPSGRDPFVCLAPLARASNRIRLGVLAISPYEMQPIKIANAILALNELSGGRSAVMIGAGGGMIRVAALKWDRMVRAVRECVEILLAASADEPLMYRGEMFRAFGYQPEWATDTPPQVYVGATEPQMLRMGARVAGRVMTSDQPMQRMAMTGAAIADGLAAAGDSHDHCVLSNFWAWHVKEDRGAAYQEARRELFLRGLLSREHIRPFIGEDEVDLVRENMSSFRNAWIDKSGNIENVPLPVVDALVEGLSCCGDMSTLDRQIERLGEFREAGVDELALRVHDDPAFGIRTIGERVIPALQ